MDDGSKLKKIADNELSEVAGGKITYNQDGSFAVYAKCPFCGKSQVAYTGSEKKHLDLAETLTCECGRTWDFSITLGL